MAQRCRYPCHQWSISWWIIQWRCKSFECFCNWWKNLCVLINTIPYLTNREKTWGCQSAVTLLLTDKSLTRIQLAVCWSLFCKLSLDQCTQCINVLHTDHSDCLGLSIFSLHIIIILITSSKLASNLNDRPQKHLPAEGFNA